MAHDEVVAEVRVSAINKLREGTEVLRKGGGAYLTTAECNALYEHFDVMREPRTVGNELEQACAAAANYAERLRWLGYPEDVLEAERIEASVGTLLHPEHDDE